MIILKNYKIYNEVFLPAASRFKYADWWRTWLTAATVAMQLPIPASPIEGRKAIVGLELLANI